MFPRIPCNKQQPHLYSFDLVRNKFQTKHPRRSSKVQIHAKYSIISFFFLHSLSLFVSSSAGNKNMRVDGREKKSRMSGIVWLVLVVCLLLELAS